MISTTGSRGGYPAECKLWDTILVSYLVPQAFKEGLPSRFILASPLTEIFAAKLATRQHLSHQRTSLKTFLP